MPVAEPQNLESVVAMNWAVGSVSGVKRPAMDVIDLMDTTTTPFRTRRAGKGKILHV
jgi:hypothetical protein